MTEEPAIADTGATIIIDPQTEPKAGDRVVVRLHSTGDYPLYRLIERNEDGLRVAPIGKTANRQGPVSWLPLGDVREIVKISAVHFA